MNKYKVMGCNNFQGICLHIVYKYNRVNVALTLQRHSVRVQERGAYATRGQNNAKLFVPNISPPMTHIDKCLAFILPHNSLKYIKVNAEQ